MKIKIVFYHALIWIVAVQYVVAQSIDPQKLQELIHMNDSLYANEILVYYKGDKVLYWRDSTCNVTNMIASSMLKSWTGLAFGTLLDRGIIKSLDELTCNWLPEWKEGCEKQVTLRHLITMTSGFNRRGGARGILAQDDHYQYLMNTKMDTVPNIRFGYSNESVQLLGMILERASGMEANEYYRKYLFEPLGMNSTTLWKDQAGKSWITYGGTTTTIHDAAKIGLLLRGKGNYNGQQIVSEAWIHQSLQPSHLVPYYGYLWWIDNQSKHKNVAASGDPGNYMIWFPNLDLLFIRNQACLTGMEYNSSRWMGPSFISKISDIVIEEIR
ncbi:MAG TPA: serine hydrolase [Saprospiraceae bacterium]|nr:serine hydrolase [Saprospiraceae bacterium]